MTSLYIVLAPLFGFALFSRIKMIAQSVKTRNSDAIKVHVFFLGLTITIGIMLALGIYTMDT